MQISIIGDYKLGSHLHLNFYYLNREKKNYKKTIEKYAGKTL